MKSLSIISRLLLVGVVVSRAIQQLESPLNGITNLLSTLEVRDLQANLTLSPLGDSSLHSGSESKNNKLKDDVPDDVHTTALPWYSEQEREDIWLDAVCRGEKLFKAMLLDENEARAMLQWPHVQSVWDGDLRNELATWGYSEDDENGALDTQCNFDATHHVADAFRDLKIDTRSAGMGGSNRCYKIVHQDGPAVFREPDGSLPEVDEQYYEVDGVEYRITGGFTKLGINSKDGVIAFIHRESSETAAEETWGQETEAIDRNSLPRLRSSSDIAYGMWYRETTSENRKDIKYFISMGIVNRETWVVISRALGLEDPEEPDGTPAWPGRQFRFMLDKKSDSSGKETLDKETQAALALLGCSNGLAVGYFLNQHKRQLGGTKYIWRVTVFTGDNGPRSSPHILYEVDTGANAPPLEEPSGRSGKKFKKKKKKLRRKAQCRSVLRSIAHNGTTNERKSKEPVPKAEF